MNKKIILIVCAIVMAIPIIGLLWWFLPYIISIKGVDEELGYEYELKGKYCYLTKYIGKETTVYVPEQLKGRKVVIYGGVCFMSTEIEEVYVPSTIEIPGYAFYDCQKLKKFSGSSNTVIYECTFFEAKDLEEVIFTNRIEKVEKDAFRFCQSLHTIDFMEDAKCIESYAFADSGIEEIHAMKDLEYVGNFAFRGTPWEKT